MKVSEADTASFLKYFMFPVQDSDSSDPDYISAQARRSLGLYDAEGESVGIYGRLYTYNSKHDSGFYKHFYDYESAVEYTIDFILNMHIENSPFLEDPHMIYKSFHPPLDVNTYQAERKLDFGSFCRSEANMMRGNGIVCGNFIIGSKEYIESQIAVEEVDRNNKITLEDHNTEIGLLYTGSSLNFAFYNRDIGDRVIMGGHRKGETYCTGIPIVYNKKHESYTPITDIYGFENFYRVLHFECVKQES